MVEIYFEKTPFIKKIISLKIQEEIKNLFKIFTSMLDQNKIMLLKKYFLLRFL